MNILDYIQRKDEILQFVKYCTVGVLNTLLCLGVIFFCKSVLEFNPYVSNALGYIVGVINSFLWNKKWVFRSDGRMARQAVVFLCGFALCYALQFFIVWALNQSSFGDLEFELGVFTLSGYGIATLIGNIAYTMANFLFNRLVTFSGRDTRVQSTTD